MEPGDINKTATVRKSKKKKKKHSRDKSSLSEGDKSTSSESQHKIDQHVGHDNTEKSRHKRDESSTKSASDDVNQRHTAEASTGNDLEDDNQNEEWPSFTEWELNEHYHSDFNESMDHLVHCGIDSPNSKKKKKSKKHKKPKTALFQTTVSIESEQVDDAANNEEGGTSETETQKSKKHKTPKKALSQTTVNNDSGQVDDAANNEVGNTLETETQKSKKHKTPKKALSQNSMSEQVEGDDIANIDVGKTSESETQKSKKHKKAKKALSQNSVSEQVEGGDVANIEEGNTPESETRFTQLTPVGSAVLMVKMDNASDGRDLHEVPVGAFPVSDKGDKEVHKKKKKKKRRMLSNADSVGAKKVKSDQIKISDIKKEVGEDGSSSGMVLDLSMDINTQKFFHGNDDNDASGGTVGDSQPLSEHSLDVNVTGDAERRPCGDEDEPIHEDSSHSKQEIPRKRKKKKKKRKLLVEDIPSYIDGSEQIESEMGVHVKKEVEDASWSALNMSMDINTQTFFQDCADELPSSEYDLAPESMDTSLEYHSAKSEDDSQRRGKKKNRKHKEEGPAGLIGADEVVTTQVRSGRKKTGAAEHHILSESECSTSTLFDNSQHSNNSSRAKKVVIKAERGREESVEEVEIKAKNGSEENGHQDMTNLSVTGSDTSTIFDNSRHSVEENKIVDLYHDETLNVDCPSSSGFVAPTASFLWVHNNPDISRTSASDICAFSDSSPNEDHVEVKEERVASQETSMEHSISKKDSELGGGEERSKVNKDGRRKSKKRKSELKLDVSGLTGAKKSKLEEKRKDAAQDDKESHAKKSKKLKSVKKEKHKEKKGDGDKINTTLETDVSGDKKLKRKKKCEGAGDKTNGDHGDEESNAKKSKKSKDKRKKKKKKKEEADGDKTSTTLTTDASGDKKLKKKKKKKEKGEDKTKTQKKDKTKKKKVKAGDKTNATLTVDASGDKKLKKKKKTEEAKDKTEKKDKPKKKKVGAEGKTNATLKVDTSGGKKLKKKKKKKKDKAEDKTETQKKGKTEKKKVSAGDETNATLIVDASGDKKLKKIKKKKTVEDKTKTREKDKSEKKKVRAGDETDATVTVDTLGNKKLKHKKKKKTEKDEDKTKKKKKDKTKKKKVKAGDKTNAPLTVDASGDKTLKKKKKKKTEVAEHKTETRIKDKPKKEKAGAGGKTNATRTVDASGEKQAKKKKKREGDRDKPDITHATEKERVEDMSNSAQVTGATSAGKTKKDTKDKQKNEDKKDKSKMRRKGSVKKSDGAEVEGSAREDVNNNDVVVDSLSQDNQPDQQRQGEGEVAAREDVNVVADSSSDDDVPIQQEGTANSGVPKQQNAKARRWSKEEDDKLRKNLKKFCKEHSIKNSHQLLFTKEIEDRETYIDVKRLIRDNNFYKELGSGINRSFTGIYNRAQRIFSPIHRTGWTDGDVEELLRLQGIHGSKWTIIGRAMERSAKSVGDKFRSVKNKRRATGEWTEEEKKLLRDAVKEIVGEPKDSFNIPWTKVAAKVPTRNLIQCREKWLSYGKNTTWTNLQAVKLIERLYESSTRTADDVDWTKLHSEHFPSETSPQMLRKRWQRLKDYYIEDHQKKSFRAIVRELYMDVIPWLKKDTPRLPDGRWLPKPVTLIME